MTSISLETIVPAMRAKVTQYTMLLQVIPGLSDTHDELLLEMYLRPPLPGLREQGGRQGALVRQGRHEGWAGEVGRRDLAHL